MIAGHEADVGSLAQGLHPQRRALELGRHADIDQIPGDGDVIGALGAQVRDQALQKRHVVEPFAPALPVDESHDPLETQIGEARHGRRAQVRVGDMRDGEAHPEKRPVRRPAKAEEASSH